MEIYQPSDLTKILVEDKNQRNAYVASSKNILSFGRFPANNYGFPEGDIKLKLGHIGVGRNRQGGFGLRHIWEKHGSECGLTCPTQIPAYLERIITVGAHVLIDKDKDPDKPLILESKVGMAILMINTPKPGAIFYTITSAYSRKSHKGNVIATL
jgi:hypothetical protein